jgi:L,D-transpeptidase catalytic domain
MNQRSVVRAAFAALLLAVATGADAQSFGSVSSGVRLPDEAKPQVTAPEAAAPAPEAPAPAAVPAAQATPATPPMPEPTAATPADATAAAASVTEPFGTAPGASGPFGVASAGIESQRAGYEPADTILVRKAERRMYLMRANRIIAEYPIRLGLNPTGHKEREGDFRTPEGLYQLVGRNPRSEYFLSLEVSYPNEEDRARAKKSGVSPGGLIMIHGQPNVPRKSPDYYANYDWTNGCIAVSNSDMVDIWLRTQPGTVIVIRP